MFLDKIQRESAKIFVDVLDEFSSVEVVLERFDQWRSKDADSYRQAYVDMFLPRLLSCIVRAQFLQDVWNPLQSPASYISKSDWLQALLRFDLASEDASLNVTCKTVELAVVPCLTEVVKGAYDPCSTSQTNLLVSLMKTIIGERLLSAVDTNKTLQLLIGAVVDKLEQAIDQDVFVPFHFAGKSWPFVNRQFWSAAKLLRNILHWQVTYKFLIPNLKCFNNWFYKCRV